MSSADRGGVSSLYDRAREFSEEGQWQEAEEQLWKVLEVENRHVGAWLDLGMLYCERGWRQPARIIFDRIAAEYAPSPLILDVIEDEIRFRCGNESGWQMAWRVGGGHDSNVNQGLLHDSITLTDVLGAYQLDVAAENKPRSGSWANQEIFLWRNGGSHSLRAQIQARQFSLGSEYNRVQAGVSGTFEGAGWRHELAGSLYARGGATEWNAFSWQSRREIPDIAEYRVSLGWGHASNTAPRNTLLAEIGVRREWLPIDRVMVGVYGGVAQAEPMSVPAPGGRRTGEVMDVWVEGGAAGWEITLRNRWRRWRDKEVYSAVLDQRRNQRLNEVSLALMHVGRQGLRCGIVIERVANRDAIALFEYRQKRQGIECGGRF